MTAERWDRVARILEAALDLPDHERDELLDRECGSDESLRRELESLLAHDAIQPASKPPRSAIGLHVGTYRIIRLIAEGGMGAVYEAERADRQFDRHVAVKLLHPGLFSLRLTERFRLERQILAKLNHPNIAALLDGGATEDGQPFLVMEYVDHAAPIHIYCRDRALPIAERLRLFLHVCDAVQYAHQNLVLHRDLKPQNILVRADGAVKLLDFGIAKLMGDEPAPLTVTDMAPMTPLYSSPEQMRGEAVTTASDVYSLGVVLYEILSDRKPYNAATWSELPRMICEVEPPPPSAIAGGRTAKQLAGDLDAIVMMALRKEPERRYQSPSELRDDLQRHLDQLPVRARRGTYAYRAARLLRRNRLAFSAATAMVLALAGGWASTARQARIAERERAVASRRFAEIRKLANSFLFEFDQAIAPLQGSTAARNLVVQKAFEYLRALEAESGGDLQLQKELASAYERVAEIQGNPSTANLGDRQGSVRTYSEALRLWRAIQQREGRNPASDRIVARIYVAMGDTQEEERAHAEALQSYQAALQIRQSLPGEADPFPLLELYGRIGSELVLLQKPGGIEWCERALSRARTLNYTSLDENSKHGLSILLSRTGQALARSHIGATAIAMHREEIAVSSALVNSVPPEKNTHYRRDLAMGHFLLARAWRLERRPSDALAELRKAQTIQEDLAHNDPADAQVRKELSITYSLIGQLLTDRRDWTNAERILAKDVRLSEQLWNQYPDGPTERANHAYSLFYLGELYRREGRPARARDYYLRQASLLRPLEASSLPEIRRQLERCYRALSEVEADPAAAARYRNLLARFTN